MAGESGNGTYRKEAQRPWRALSRVLARTLSWTQRLPTFCRKKEATCKAGGTVAMPMKISKSVESHVPLDSPLDMSEIYTLRTRQIRIHLNDNWPAKIYNFTLACSITELLSPFSRNGKGSVASVFYASRRWWK
jgi:hypothetical protein